jgi:hypothetical protein
MALVDASLSFSTSSSSPFERAIASLFSAGNELLATFFGAL